MSKTPLRSEVSAPSVPASDLLRLVHLWLLDGEIAQHSSRTAEFRRMVTDNLAWFLRSKGLSCIDKGSLRLFLAYVSNGHTEPGGRWGNPQQTKRNSSRTVKDYYCTLRTWFRWMITQEELDASPLDGIPVPIHRHSQIKPFSPEQVEQQLDVARSSEFSRRDVAILLFLLDTGVRVSELCGLTHAKLDLTSRSATVLGKGDKERTVYYGRQATKALYAYIKEKQGIGRSLDTLFISVRGLTAGEQLTRSGVLQLCDKVGARAGVTGVRCSPHTWRHTFAVQFICNGGNQFTLMQLMGHTDLEMTNRYVHLAQVYKAFLADQHRDNSPVDRRKTGKG